MQTWFEVKVKYVKIDQDGREKKVSESYLVDAVSFTDAETRTIQQMQQIIRGEFHIDNIKKSNIIEIFPAESGEYWYKARIAIVTIDEKAGKEKKVNNYFLVAADDFKEAFQRLEEGLSYILVPYNTTSMALSPIVDVFPYFSEDQQPQEVPPHLKPVEQVHESTEDLMASEQFEESDAEEGDFDDDPPIADGETDEDPNA
ncbi:DUF4494 domain-containing protein [Mangrovibacterium marinum]|uniref:DUF4494 domain-containing protein n=1 Tax=Mangrovibacterium marinum TaxID=1639118 RepID=UPI002A18B459|nr:DUF4494 domain-containing protein [Mangrovibacterium marinum]